MVKTKPRMRDQNQAERLNQLVGSKSLWSQEKKIAAQLNCFLSIEVWKSMQSDWLRIFLGNIYGVTIFLNMHGVGVVFLARLCSLEIKRLHSKYI